MCETCLHALPLRSQDQEEIDQVDEVVSLARATLAIPGAHIAIVQPQGRG